MNSNVNLLEFIRVLADIYDDMYNSVECIASIKSRYKERTQPFTNIYPIDQDTIQQLVNALPPERNAALIETLGEVSELIHNPNNDQKKLIESAKEQVKDIKAIRDRLQAALDEET